MHELEATSNSMGNSKPARRFPMKKTLIVCLGVCVATGLIGIGLIMPAYEYVCDASDRTI